MMDMEAIFAADREHPPHERSLPWPETQNGMTVIVEPKHHWASDMRAFRAGAQEYCSYADWAEHGARARFFGHIAICGDDLMRKARALIACEIAQGQWK
ncbi:hypothetical protein [Rhodoblastus sp.]|uniref:hypothetical protein n=1 Tax=Rhodoblastus sp. TaxID=1962975 RepID=UPI003F976CBA